MKFRTEFRAHWRAWLGLAVLVGVGGGASIAAAVGARRTESAYPRYLAWSRASDVSVGFGELDDPGPMEKKVFSLPQVVAYSSVRLLAPEIVTEGGQRLTSFELAAVADPAGRFAVEWNRPRVVDGRMFDATRTDEAVVPRLVAKQFGFRVGDRLTVRLGRFAEDGTGVAVDARRVDLAVRIVGIVVGPQDLAPARAGFSVLILPPAVPRRYAEIIPPPDNNSFSVNLRHGAADVDAFLQALDRIDFNGDIPDVQRDLTATVQRSLGFESTALWLLSALIALAALALIGQALARQARVEAGDYPVLRALGVSRRQLFAVGVGRALAIGTLGGLLAVLIATALSPLTPIGNARLAEPHPGVWVDALALTIGAAAIVLAIVLIAIAPVWRIAGRFARPEMRPARRRSVLFEFATRSTAPVTAVTGLWLAIGHGRERAVPVRAAVLGAAFSVAAITAAFTMGSSLGLLLDRPDLSGYTWDLMTFSSTRAERAPVAAALHASRRVDTIALSTIHSVNIGSRRNQSAFVVDDSGPIHPVMLSGRRPTRSDEIALGPQTMKELGTGIGDSVTISVNSGGSRGPRRLRVVGRAITPQFIYEQHKIGEGAVLTLDGYRRLNSSADDSLGYIVRLKNRADVNAAAVDLNAAIPGALQQVRQQSEDLANLQRVRGIPYVLAWLVALLGGATLAHALVSGVRSGRRDLAILKALGFDKTQIRASVAWQSTLIVSLGLVVGLPTGLVAAQRITRLYAEQLVVLPPPSVIPGVAIAIIVPAALLLALLISGVPGRLAANTQAARSLTTE